MFERAKKETIYTVPALGEFESFYDILDQKVGSKWSAKENLATAVAAVGPTAYIGILTNFFNAENAAVVSHYISGIIGQNVELDALSFMAIFGLANVISMPQVIQKLGYRTGLGSERNARIRDAYSGMLGEMKKVDKGLRDLDNKEKSKQMEELQSTYEQITSDYRAFLDGKTDKVPVAIREKLVRKKGVTGTANYLWKDYKRTELQTTPPGIPQDIGSYKVYYVSLERPKDLK